jgi:hypothetical protein
MPLLEKLEKGGIDTYEDAVREIKQMNKELSFYTPKHKVVVKGIFHNDYLKTVISNCF